MIEWTTKRPVYEVNGLVLGVIENWITYLRQNITCSIHIVVIICKSMMVTVLWTAFT